MICEGLRTLLLAQSAVTDLVGDKIFFESAKQGTERPYIVIDEVSDEKHKTLEGYLGAKHCEIDIECWHNTPSQAKNLAKIIGDYLDDFTGAAGNETILESTHADDTSTYDPPQSGSAISEFVTILNFEFQYRE